MQCPWTIGYGYVTATCNISEQNDEMKGEEGEKVIDQTKKCHLYNVFYFHYLKYVLKYILYFS